MASHSVAGKQECEVCGGPCREPFKQPAVEDNYPFMTPEQIVESQRINEPEPEVEPATPKGKRARRLREDRAHRPSEDRRTET